MKIKVTFVMSTLGTGGAERVISNILRYIDANKFEITLLILLSDNNDYLNSIPEHVKVLNLGHSRTKNAIKDLISELNKINSDIIFSSLRGMSLILSIIKPLLNKKPKFIFREENTPSISIKSDSLSWIYWIYYQTLYKRADQIICQSDYMAEDLIKTFNFPEKKITRIYNPVDIDGIKSQVANTEDPFNDKTSKNVVVAGRMVQQKGIDSLLYSIAEKKSVIERKQIKVFILGEGKLKKDYEKLSVDLEITQYVKFVGRQSNPFNWFKYCDLFLLPSRYEGLPNSLLEALAVKCEPVATIHPGGTTEIMKIVDREEYLTTELNWSDEWFDQRSNPLNYNEFINNFDAKKIVKKYEELFIKTLYT